METITYSWSTTTSHKPQPVLISILIFSTIESGTNIKRQHIYVLMLYDQLMEPNSCRDNSLPLLFRGMLFQEAGEECESSLNSEQLTLSPPSLPDKLDEKTSIILVIEEGRGNWDRGRWVVSIVRYCS